MMAAFSYVVARGILFGLKLPFTAYLGFGLVLFVAICSGVFVAMKLYNGLWRYASLQDLLAIIMGAALSSLLFFPYVVLTSHHLMVGMRGLFLNWLLLIVFLGGPRFFYRIFKDKVLYPLWMDAERRIPVILIGLNDNSELFIREISRRNLWCYHVVGVVDLNAQHKGSTIHLAPIIGGMEAIEKVIEHVGKKGMRPQKLIVTDEHLSIKDLKQLWKIANDHGLSMAKLPKLAELANFQSESAVVRPIALEDLLGRPQVVLDDSSIAELIKGKAILVTGAGGTIGSELCRQVSRYKPSILVMLDNSEYNLYVIT